MVNEEILQFKSRLSLLIYNLQQWGDINIKDIAIHTTDGYRILLVPTPHGEWKVDNYKSLDVS